MSPKHPYIVQGFNADRVGGDAAPIVALVLACAIVVIAAMAATHGVTDQVGPFPATIAKEVHR